MRRPSSLRTLVVWVLPVALGAAAPASGQYRPPAPVPEPSPTPSPDPGAEPGEAPTAIVAPTRTAGWDTTLLLDGVWEENVGLLDPPGPSDFFGSVRGSLARWTRRPKSELRIGGDLGGYAYAELSNRNRVDGGLSGNGTFRLSPRVTANLNAGYSRRSTDVDQALIDSGVVLPLTRTKTGSVGAGMSWRATERMTLAFGGGWSHVEFDTEALLDTESWSANALASRRLGTRDDVSANLRWVRTSDSAGVRQDPSFTLGYQKGLSTRLSLRVNAGAARNTIFRGGSDSEAARWSFTGGGGLSGRIRRASLTLDYSHGLYPTPGLGVTELTDIFTAGAVVPIGRSFQAIATGVFSSRTDLNVPDGPRARYGDLYVAGSVTLSRNTSLVGGYRFRFVDAPSRPELISNNRVSVSFLWRPPGGKPAGGPR